MPLELTDRYRPRTRRDFVERVVAAALDFVERPDLEISVLLTDDVEIARIHGEYMDDPSPTDVITFPLDDQSVDLVISVERARERAEELGHSIRAELALYLVHGILHASGYDDTTAKARVRMRRAELEVLAALGLRVAPVD